MSGPDEECSFATLGDYGIQDGSRLDLHELSRSTTPTEALQHQGRPYFMSWLNGNERGEEFEAIIGVEPLIEQMQKRREEERRGEKRREEERRGD